MCSFLKAGLNDGCPQHGIRPAQGHNHLALPDNPVQCRLIRCVCNEQGHVLAQAIQQNTLVSAGGGSGRYRNCTEGIQLSPYIISRTSEQHSDRKWGLSRMTKTQPTYLSMAVLLAQFLSKLFKLGPAARCHRPPYALLQEWTSRDTFGYSIQRVRNDLAPECSPTEQTHFNRKATLADLVMMGKLLAHKPAHRPRRAQDDDIVCTGRHLQALVSCCRRKTTSSLLACVLSMKVH